MKKRRASQKKQLGKHPNSPQYQLILTFPDGNREIETNPSWLFLVLLAILGLLLSQRLKETAGLRHPV
jgi:hypothetical protein